MAYFGWHTGEKGVSYSGKESKEFILKINTFSQRSKKMNARTISMIALCTALSACNPKAPEPAATSTDTASKVPETSAAAPVAATKPAPEGLPSRVAREVIKASGQKCDAVAKADRNVQDGSIVASCTGGESYRVYTIEGQGPVATKL